MHRKGVVLVFISAVLWSTAGLFVRVADLDTWTMVAWRSMFACVILGGVAVFKSRGQLWRAVAKIGMPELFFVAVSVFSGITYVLALRLTTVANVMTIYAALPFIATAIAFFWLQERVTMRFLIAGFVAVVAISITTGAVATRQDLQGILAALAMTAGFATQLVQAKRYPLLNTTLLIALSAGVCVIVAAPLAKPGVPSLVSLLACAAYGLLTTGLAYVLALEGGRLTTSGEAGLISMLDVVLGPLWVWFFFAERPTPIVIASGIAVLGSVVWYLSGLRTNPQKAVTDEPIAAK